MHRKAPTKVSSAEAGAMSTLSCFVSQWCHPPTITAVQSTNKCSGLQFCFARLTAVVVNGSSLKAVSNIANIRSVPI